MLIPGKLGFSAFSGLHMYEALSISNWQKTQKATRLFFASKLVEAMCKRWLVGGMYVLFNAEARTRIRILEKDIVPEFLLFVTMIDKAYLPNIT